MRRSTKRRPLLSASEQREFGAWLKVCREIRKLSVHTVAIELAETAAKRPTRKASPLQRANASQLRAREAGSVPPSEDTLRRLAPLYGQSVVDVFIRGGFLENVLPLIVGLLKDSRVQRFDRPFSRNASDLADGNEPASTYAAILMADRTFPSTFDVSPWSYVSPHYYFLFAEPAPQTRRPTRLPRLIMSAMKALRDPLVKNPVRRRSRAFAYFQDWLLHFEPALYHVYFPDTSGGNEDNDR